MLGNKTYERLSIRVCELEEADVVTASGVTASWKSTWGDSWDDYNVGEEW